MSESNNTNPFAEADRIMAMTDEEIRAMSVAEFGSEEAALSAAADLRAKMLAAVDAHVAGQSPTPDIAVMRDYIDRLTRFFIDRPEWIELAEEARGYIGALKAEGSADTEEQVRSQSATNHTNLDQEGRR